MKLNWWLRKGISAAFIALLGFSLLTSSAWAATNTVKVESRTAELVFDGKKLAIPQGQYIFAVNGTSYVPVRFISYALQKSVVWDAKTKTVSIKEPSKQQSVLLKEYLINSVANADEPSAKGGAKLSVTPIQVKFMFDGEMKNLPKGQSGYNLNGSIYVPVRFMSESVGTDIKWDGKTGKISAESPVYQKERKEKGNETDPVIPNEVPAKDENLSAYESITSSTEAKLRALETSCTNNLLTIALSGSSNEQKKTGITNELANCSNQFNSIVNETEQLLIKYEYSTAVIAEYKAYFQNQLDAGAVLLESLAK